MSVYTTLALLLFLSGCTTAWKFSGRFERTIQTQLSIDSTPQSRISINEQDRGTTPLTTTLEYHQVVRKETRKVSYWVTKPDVAFAVTILSLGIYLPLSVIPVDIETRLMPATYVENTFQLRATQDGYDDWVEEIHASGEPTLSREVLLKQTGMPQTPECHNEGGVDHAC